MDDDSSEKKAKETKRCIIKVIINFKNYEGCDKSDQTDNIIKYLGKNWS